MFEHSDEPFGAKARKRKLAETRKKRRRVMEHNCPECGELCNCGDAEDCRHECDEDDYDGLDDDDL